MAITASFSVPLTAHSSLVVMRRSSGIDASTLSLISVVAAVAGRPLRDLSPAPFSLFQKSVNLYRTGVFCSKKISRHSWPSTFVHTFAILHCCYVERTWLTGVPVILVVLDSIAIRWVKQDTLSGATFNIINKNRKHYLRTDLCTLKVLCFRSISWAGVVATIDVIRIAYKNLIAKSEVWRSHGESRYRWKNSKADITKDRVWGFGMGSARSERRWRSVVSIVVELRIS